MGSVEQMGMATARAAMLCTAETVANYVKVKVRVNPTLDMIYTVLELISVLGSQPIATSGLLLLPSMPEVTTMGLYDILL